MTKLGQRGVVIIAVGVFVVAAVGCGDGDKSVAAVKTPPLVSVTQVKDAAPTQLVILSGQLRARHETSLGFRVAGKIATRNVDAGQSVKKGDVLFTLDAADYQLKVDAMRAQETAARAQFTNASDELGRHKRMLAKELVSQAQFDRVKSAYDEAKAGLDAAISARVNAENDASYTKLVADGPAIISEVHADVGQVVAAGTPVTTTARIDEIEAEAYIPEKYASQVKIGDKASVRVNALGETRLEGSLREIAGVADPRTRTYRARVGFNKAPEILKLGMSSDVLINVPLAAPGVLIPPEAICDGDVPHVWILGADSQAVRCDVKIEGSEDGAFIVSGVKSGETLIVEGARFLKGPQQVRTAGGVQNSAAKK
jgi:membrane fusion protein, multidrug efflux system